MLRFSVLDQSPVFKGMTDAEAVQQTLNLAVEIEKLGYHRFWVSEHHNSRSFASASPEIMVGRIASITKKIRVGSAGVLLSLYSPLKVAEQFNLLTTLFPGRIDLGIGRAGGSDPRTLSVLNPNVNAEDAFVKFDNMIAFMTSENSKLGVFRNIQPVPSTEFRPEFWVLGSSPASGLYAGQRGLPYAFASFINADSSIQALQAYFQHFQPSRFLDKPYVNLAVAALCADTEVRARKLIKSIEVWAVRSFLQNMNIPFPSIKEAENAVIQPHERVMLEHRRQSFIIGSVEQVSSQLRKLAKQLMINEFTIVTITEPFQDRLASYRLLAKAFDL